jgi:catechol 2,3-dioxygenase-like lactoylglutathione lyase family enzyme
MLGAYPVFAVVPCVDLPGARKFYSETLGLTEVEMAGMPEEAKETGALFECGQGTNILVYARAEPTKADHTAAGWLVPDLDAVVDQLIDRGVTMEVYDMPDVEWDERGVAHMGPNKAVWFKDPAGNILSVNEITG